MIPHEREPLSTLHRVDGSETGSTPRPAPESPPDRRVLVPGCPQRSPRRSRKGRQGGRLVPPVQAGRPGLTMSPGEQDRNVVTKGRVLLGVVQNVTDQIPPTRSPRSTKWTRGSRRSPLPPPLWIGKDRRSRGIAIPTSPRTLRRVQSPSTGSPISGSGVLDFAVLGLPLGFDPGAPLRSQGEAGERGTPLGIPGDRPARAPRRGEKGRGRSGGTWSTKPGGARCLASGGGPPRPSCRGGGCS